MQISFQNQKGFTLLELLLYVAITALLLTAVSIFMSALLQARIKNQTIAEIDGQGMQVMHMITQTVRNASVINTPAIGASGASLSVGSYTGANDPTIFDLSGTTLQMKEGTASPIALTNTRVAISGLTFSNLSRASTPGSVRIQFTMTYVNTTGLSEYNYSKTFQASASLRQP